MIPNATRSTTREGTFTTPSLGGEGVTLLFDTPTIVARRTVVEDTLFVGMDIRPQILYGIPSAVIREVTTVVPKTLLFLCLVRRGCRISLLTTLDGTSVPLTLYVGGTVEPPLSAFANVGVVRSNATMKAPPSWITVSTALLPLVPRPSVRTAGTISLTSNKLS